MTKNNPRDVTRDVTRTLNTIGIVWIKDAGLIDGQDAGKALLMIEARIGELASKVPQERRGRLSSPPRGQAEKHERLGLTRKQMHHAEAIHSHPREVEEVIRVLPTERELPKEYFRESLETRSRLLYSYR